MASAISAYLILINSSHKSKVVLQLVEGLVVGLPELDRLVRRASRSDALVGLQRADRIHRLRVGDYADELDLFLEDGAHLDLPRAVRGVEERMVVVRCMGRGVPSTVVM